MKILLTIHEVLAPNSGSAGSVFRVGQQYEALGHDVYYYSHNDLPKQIIGKARRVLFPVFTAKHLVKLLRETSIDVVDTSTRDAWIWGGLLQNLYRDRPLLVTRSHGLEHIEHHFCLEEARQGSLKLSWKYYLYHGGFYLWEAAMSLRHADLAFLLNRCEADYVIQQLGVAPERTCVFPNGIPDEFLGLPFTPTPTTNTQPIRIAQIGTYIPRKGIEYSAPALNQILQRYPFVEISFLGTECLQCLHPDSVYADFDPSVRDRVHVIPRFKHEDLPTLLQNHHIKLFPTLNEGFGKALIEAMACGLAPITTPAEGPRDVVTDGHDALIVPLRDSKAIVTALERLINDRVYLNQLRHSAYITAQQYSWKKIAQNRLDAYEKALAKKLH